MEAGTTVLLKCKGTLFPKPYQIVQAEFVSLSSDAVAEYDIQNIGFAGNGYVKLPSHEGAYITWEQLDGKEGGEHIIRIRYSLEDNRQASHILTVNGKSYRIKLEPTGGGTKYNYFSISVPLQKGKTIPFIWKRQVTIIVLIGLLCQLLQEISMKYRYYERVETYHNINHLCRNVIY